MLFLSQAEHTEQYFNTAVSDGDSPVLKTKEKTVPATENMVHFSCYV